MTTYPWKRFWCNREDGFTLDDDGYLHDPDSKYGTHFNPHIAPLSAFTDYPCLVMLGEPGIGKSTEFQAEVQRITQASALRCDIVRIDLKEYQTDGRLVADAFENDIVQQWVSGSHSLYLFFDSLDEGRLEVRNIANILAGQLKRLASDASRLRIRIACRTAEWPATLEDSLKTIWGVEGVAVLELTPLRRRDVISAAEIESINPQPLLEEIRLKEVQPFAINPITLRFLLKLYARSFQLPMTKQAIYEAGCLTLCDESSQSRRDSVHFGRRSKAQRLQIASRIAAFTIFSGRSTIDLAAGHDPNTAAITIADIAGGWEMVGEDRFDVMEADVREVLGTTLFSGRGAEKLGFAHWSFAEFLAARYIHERHIDDTQISSLIFHPENETRVAPQLEQTAAWIAVGNNHLFERMMAGDPHILLRGDVSTTDDSMKQRLLCRLIEGFQNDELDDSDWDLRKHYHKLSHAGLSTQLKTLLLDRNQKMVTRRFIVKIAEACQQTGLLSTLITVALDNSDDPHIRAQACHAIITIGDDISIKALRPLALGQGGKDPDDDLRGYALRGLWSRRLMTADELFNNLVLPKQRSLYGAYRMFLFSDLEKQLTPGDLLPGMRWCNRCTSENDDIDDFRHARAEIVRQSMTHLDNSELLKEISTHIVSKFERYEQFHMDEYRTTSTEDRRKLLSTIVNQMNNPNNRVWSLASLTLTEDLEWLFIQANAAESIKRQECWAHLSRILFFAKRSIEIGSSPRSLQIKPNTSRRLP